MSFMKGIAGFAIFVLVVVGVLFIMSGDDYPPVPSDDVHRAISDNTVCMECHGPDKEHPLKEDHPPKFECLKCHKRTG
jgi:hypothetical protein